MRDVSSGRRVGTAAGMNRTGSRIVTAAIAGTALVMAAAGVRSLMIGVPAHDRWLFPLTVVLPFAVAAALALSLRASTATRANVLLLGMAVVFGLYAVDAVFELMPASADPLPREIAADAGRAFDSRSRFDVVRDLRAQGTEAYPSFGTRALRSSPAQDGPGVVLNGKAVAPLAQIRNSTIVDCNESGQFAVFRSDENGFNNPPGSWQGPIDVAAVGDSYIQGSCVDPADNLVAGIRRGVPNTIGLGLGDSGPLVMLGMIKEYLADVRPRDVLWFFYEGNDFRNLRAELAVPELRQYLEPDRIQGLRALQPGIDSVLIPYVDELLGRPDEDGDESGPVAAPALRTLVRHWLRLFALRDALALTDIGSRLQRCCDPDMLEAVLAEADRTVSEWGGRLHFVYLPAAGRFAHPMSAILDDDLRYRSQVLGIARHLGLPVIDVNDVFEATGNPEGLVFNPRSHFNPAGYRVAAEAVLRHLEEQSR